VPVVRAGAGEAGVERGRGHLLRRRAALGDGTGHADVVQDFHRPLVQHVGLGQVGGLRPRAGQQVLDPEPGLAAGLRDADNLAWKLAHVLTGRAGAGLLTSYETERRPHAKALINKAVRVGWAMTGGQDRAAAVRRIALAAAVRSERISEFMGATATPRLKAGALHQPPHRFLPSGIPPALRPGSLIPNPLVTAGDAQPVRLDTILAGRPAVLTARRPDAGLADFCRQHGLILVRISSTPGSRPGTPARPSDERDADWIDVRLADDAPPAGILALVADPALTVIVRPDRVVAAVEPRHRLPRLPWYAPASAVPGYRAPAPCPARPEPVGPLPAAR
jgi:3-(3-hydroxy-phenyl)propionate hydroxylase